MEPDAFLVETDEPEVAEAIGLALTEAGIPYRIQDEPGRRNWAVVFVPWRRLAEAQALVHDELVAPEELSATFNDGTRAEITPFPWGPFQSVSGLILAHLAVVLWAANPPARYVQILEQYGLAPNLVGAEPWRLLTALVLHMDLKHALVNGITMIIFAVPLLGWLGYAQTGMLYIGAGVGGGLAAMTFGNPGSIAVGSSGAVAGLFGAWLLLTLRRAKEQRQGWRPKVRALGIGLLVLPSLLGSPLGPPVSVSSHLGGLASGVAIALVTTPQRPRVDPFTDPAGEPYS